MRIEKENEKDIFGWGGKMRIKKENWKDIFGRGGKWGLRMRMEKIYLGEEENED